MTNPKSNLNSDYFKDLMKNPPQATPPANPSYGGGRTSSWGKGGRGRGGDFSGRSTNRSQSSFRKQNQSNPFRDPWEGEQYPVMEYSGEGELTLLELLNREESFPIEADDVEELSPREGDSILLYVLAVRGKKVMRNCKAKRQAVANHFRYHSRAKMVQLINNEKELLKQMQLMVVRNFREDTFDHETPPIEFKDLMDDELLAQWAAAPTVEEKKMAVIQLITMYLLRHFEPTGDLRDMIESLHSSTPDYLQAMMQKRGILHKHNMRRGNGRQCRFIPLDIALEDYAQRRWPPQDYEQPKENSDQGKQKKDDGNRFSALGDNDPTEGNVEITELDQSPSEKSSENPNQGNSGDESKNSVATQEESAAAAIQVHEHGLMHPATQVHVEQERIENMGEDDVKDYLIGLLREYIYGYFSERGEELLEHIRIKNSITIMALIREKGKIAELAKKLGIPPTLRIVESSPHKVSGSHPLAANVYRTYTLRCSKQNSGSMAPAAAACGALGKIFKVVEGLSGDHVVRLIPFNPSDNSQQYPALLGIQRDHSHLPGAYLGNVFRQSWQKKLDWEMRIESSLDLAYLINVSNSRGSPMIDSLHHYMKKNDLQMKIINIEESNMKLVAVAVKTNKFDEAAACKDELVDALELLSSYTADPTQFDLQWRNISLPADQTQNAMIGAIVADPRSAESLMKALFLLNQCGRNRSIFPRTHDWVFYAAQIGSTQKYPLEDAIKRQREYQSERIYLSIVGIEGVNIMNHCPSRLANGMINTTEKTIAHLMVDDNLFDKDDKGWWLPTPFDHVYPKSQQLYVLSAHVSKAEQIERCLTKTGKLAVAMKNWLSDTEMSNNISKVKAILTMGENSNVPAKTFSLEEKTGANPNQSNENDAANSHGDLQTSTQNGEIEGESLRDSQNQGMQQSPQQFGLQPNLEQNSLPLPPAPMYNQVYPPLQRAVYMPSGEGVLTMQGLQILIDEITAHLRTQISFEMERAFRILDPAGRLMSLVEERDRNLEHSLIPDIFTTIVEAQRVLMDEYISQLHTVHHITPRNTEEMGVQSEQRVEEGQGNELIGQPTQEEDEIVGIPTSTAADSAKTTEGTLDSTKYHTPTTGMEMLELEARALEDEMEKKKLSFDQYADGRDISPIREGTEDSEEYPMSPNTALLKRQLNETTEKSTWELNATIEEAETQEDQPESREENTTTAGEKEAASAKETEAAEGASGEPNPKNVGEVEADAPNISPANIIDRVKHRSRKQNNPIKKISSQIRLAKKPASNDSQDEAT